MRISDWSSDVCSSDLEAGIVPIVEPEVLMDADNTLEVCESVTSRTLEAVFAELDLQRVLLEGMILKPNMVISGKKCATQADRAAVAAATVRTLKRHVPGAVPGIAFLRSEEQTSELQSLMRISYAVLFLKKQNKH